MSRQHPVILATGSAVPDRVVTNAEVDALIGASTDAWLVANVGIRERRLGYARLLGWPALFCIGGFLLLPRLLLGGSYVDMRMMPAIWILALLAIRPPPPGRLASVLALAGLAFFAIRTAATTLSLLLVTAEQQTELAAVQHIPRGAAVLTLIWVLGGFG